MNGTLSWNQASRGGRTVKDMYNAIINENVSDACRLYDCVDVLK